MLKLAPPRLTILLLLSVALVNGILWSILIPPFHAPDENYHFEYAQIIERFKVLHPDPGMWQLREIGVAWDLVQIHPVRFDPFRILDLSDRRSIAELIHSLNDPEIQRGYVYDEGIWFAPFRNFTYDHPPLYYFLIGAVQSWLEDKSIIVRILFNRWVSVFIGVVAVALSYRAGKEIWQDEGWACFLASLVCFQPMVTFLTSVVGDGALGIAMFSACTWLILRVIRKGWTARRALAIALLLGLGLLARTSLVILIPILILSFLWESREFLREHKYFIGALAPIVMVLAITLLIAGWWYKSSGIDNSDSRISLFISGIIGLGTNWRNTPTSFDWFAAFSPVLGMYWGNFGWLDTPFPQGLYQVLAGLSLIALWTTFWWILRRHFSSGQTTESKRPFMFFLLGIQTIFLILLYSYYDLRFFNMGGTYHPQGRYFLPAIIGQMAWLAVGLISPIPARFRQSGMWIVTMGMIVLNVYALFSVITLRYYGARNLLLVADRASVFQPVSPATILTLSAIFFLLVGAVSLGIWRTFKNVPDWI
jgi:hypothetical protein